MKTSPRARSNQPSKDEQDLNVPAPKTALTSESMPHPMTNTGIAPNWPSQGQPVRQSSPSKPLDATFYREERKALVDMTGLVSRLVKSNLKLWKQDESLYYEYVVGSLFRHQMIDDNRVINFEKYRRSNSSNDASIMELVYPICLDVIEASRFHLLQADLEDS